MKNNVERIIVTGDLAKEMIAAQKKKAMGKKVGIAGGIGIAAATVAGIALAPFTAGASVAATASALTATIGGVTVAATTAEVAIISATVASTILGVAGISSAIINTVAKNYNVKVNAGNTTVECTRKQ